MKVCTQCERTFDDNSLNYCLSDGAPLVPVESQPTVVIPTAVSTQPDAGSKKRNPALLIVGIIAATIIAAALVVAIVIYAYRLGGDQARNERNGVANAPTPRSSATPKPSPSVTASATPADATPTPASGSPGEDPDEITPIQWSTAAGSFKVDEGRIYKFECPPDGTPGVVWGSDIYTTDSSICTAAVHAGVININDGGVVVIEMRPGRRIYGSTKRNDITSSTYGEYQHSFIVKSP